MIDNNPRSSFNAGSFVKVGGLLAKKQPVSVYVYPDRIKGEGFDLLGADLVHTNYDIPYAEINALCVEKVEGKDSVVIKCKRKAFFGEKREWKTILIGIENPQTVEDAIQNAKTDYSRKREEDRQRKLEYSRQMEVEKQKIESEAETFYRDCYQFHIQDDALVFPFSSDKNRITAMYIGKDKSLNFLRIDGYTKTEEVGTIPFQKIHYYEKAGNVSYTTDLHGKYSSFGGSMTGASFSKGTAAAGGLLFGYMGMIAGALFSYQPAQAEPQKVDLSLESEVVKIDDRSVILNFFSDARKQYVDIELPQNTYNFLQTHLQEKKYGIVEEIERKTALHQSMQAAQQGAAERIGAPSPGNALPENTAGSLESFKMKVEKLKLMREADLLTDVEFEAEKKKLLSQL